jgi:8-oxo-dGTP pyrophosphatase MutT (NUDIX family)
VKQVAARREAFQSHLLLTRILHLGVYVFHSLRRSVWFFTRPPTRGVHGIPLTPDGKVVLVMLSYAKGWRLPGGGVKKGEDQLAGMLRELREEIGLTAYSDVEPICDFKHQPDFREGNATLFVVRGVTYHPRWSLEVRAVAEFHLSKLPADSASITLKLLALAKPKLR